MAKEYPLLVGHCDRGHKRLRSVNDVADFIIKHGKYGDVNVTFENGRFFLDTYGIYLNNIIDQEYREELLKVLIPKQMEVDGTEDADFIENEEDESNNFEMEM